MPTEMELTLEQTQQGVSYKVSTVMDPVTLCTKPSLATQGLSKDYCFISHRGYNILSTYYHSMLVDIEKRNSLVSLLSVSVCFETFCNENMSILTDLKDYLKMGVEVPNYRLAHKFKPHAHTWPTNKSYGLYDKAHVLVSGFRPTLLPKRLYQSNEVLKIKEIQEFERLSSQVNK
ncbi:hypothetical protein Tco_1042220 [Tanacetum coccineum]|uniref:Uncharacterized protein n=1 Tax=Tanacetum coccineum TaxID=301880 RepID=A0ABQ5GJQ3_9ASTR